MTAHLIEVPGTEGRLSIHQGGRCVGYTLPPLVSGGYWEAYWRDAHGRLLHGTASNADDAATVLRDAIKEI